MKKLTKLPLYVTTALILVGCSGAGQIAPEQKPIKKQVTLEKSYDKTWESVVDWFALNNTILERVDKEDGLITSARNLRAGHEVDCGKAKGQISWASA
ncbi:hypothetical protein, partial [Endozoicomonas sp. ONNA1]|uniref:hypothetical protein n=1 Tax=Endozoicomonas sp. ONNA1 TaxID=2828740 RepID=UPI0021478E51